MKNYKIYLDTSVINFLFADDAPEKKEITIDFFDNFVKTRIYETYISEFVLAEIEDTTNIHKRKNLLKVIEKYDLLMLSIVNDTEIQHLANKYIEKRIIPERKIVDAYHIATCVLSDIDYLVSWNYKHMANIKKESEVESINIENNLNHKLRIITPTELIYEI